MTDRSTILIVEDHALLAEGLATALRASGLVVDVISGPSRDAIVDYARMVDADLVLLDLMLGDEIGSTIPIIAPLRSAGAEVLMLTGVTDRSLLDACLAAGASGLASKSTSFDGVLEQVIDTLHGRPTISDRERTERVADFRIREGQERERLATFERLTAREASVLSALMEGQSAEVIARGSFVSVATVRSQIRSILEKLSVRSQLAAVALAHRCGWQPPSAR